MYIWKQGLDQGLLIWYIADRKYKMKMKTWSGTLQEKLEKQQQSKSSHRKINEEIKLMDNRWNSQNDERRQKNWQDTEQNLGHYTQTFWKKNL